MESIIIAVIVGLIGLFVNSKKGEKTEEKKPIQRPVFSPEKRETVTKKLETVIPKVTSKIEKHNPKKIEIMEKVSKLEEVHELPPIQEKVTQTNQIEVPKKLEVDENDLLKGIILSEVLGPSRAKRPYRGR
ncbi:hypothetical protein ACQKP0_16875 [Heyndrickxia sp. NPDC080065]|uniref:hypothetical protein n=1 Tax=Heyndrickxia sp. NPDC080065 TaxID=3390568 RepID=UPI003CFDABE7